MASPQLQDLHKCLEVDFDPLMLCNRVHDVIKTLETDDNTVLQQYICALQDVTLVRLVRQIAQVYQSIEFARLIQIAKFTTPFHLERLLVDCVRHNDMQIRIDHGKRCIHFGMDLSESQREDKPEGPTLQMMPSEQVRNQLVDMATVLGQAIHVVNPNKKKVRSLIRYNYRTGHFRLAMSEYENIAYNEVINFFRFNKFKTDHNSRFISEKIYSVWMLGLQLRTLSCTFFVQFRNHNPVLCKKIVMISLFV